MAKPPPFGHRAPKVKIYQRKKQERKTAKIKKLPSPTFKNRNSLIHPDLELNEAVFGKTSRIKSILKSVTGVLSRFQIVAQCSV